MIYLTVLFNVLKKVEDIRNSIEEVQKCVNDVKQLHSKILSAPTTDESNLLTINLVHFLRP